MTDKILIDRTLAEEAIAAIHNTLDLYDRGIWPPAISEVTAWGYAHGNLRAALAASPAAPQVDNIAHLKSDIKARDAVLPIRFARAILKEAQS